MCMLQRTIPDEKGLNMSLKELLFCMSVSWREWIMRQRDSTLTTVE